MTASLDHDYRKMVSDAAGVPYLDNMTQECLQSVQALLQEQPALGEALRSRAHRLAGGTATVGLPAVAASLKALEKTCSAQPEADAAPLYADCQARLAEVYEALAAEASSRSSL